MQKVIETVIIYPQMSLPQMSLFGTFIVVAKKLNSSKRLFGTVSKPQDLSCHVSELYSVLNIFALN